MIKLKTLLKESQKLFEEYIGKYNNKFEVFKNPKTISRMEGELRAISFPNGNLFVIDDSMHVIHTPFATWLNDNGYKIKDSGTNSSLSDNLYKGYIYWQRKGKTNEFWLSESIVFKGKEITDYVYGYFNEKELMPILKKYSKKVKQKNSQYKFVLKSIIDA